MQTWVRRILRSHETSDGHPVRGSGGWARRQERGETVNLLVGIHESRGLFLENGVYRRLRC